ncbi:hypothetical protein O181_020399 [Austropuccinia psidii MF-1]|uniref:Uncharacterized protein n=1 Tax=Austropuccinia psidii MF-1 TaxID=1389203 RepID=A0A9Q3GVN2_9BASI|nr:hypothetical protein [Austropuccinia psidii MF-1]
MGGVRAILEPADDSYTLLGWSTSDSLAGGRWLGAGRVRIKNPLQFAPTRIEGIARSDWSGSIGWISRRLDRKGQKAWIG